MKCTILSVGTELLFGSILNTNTAYLSQQMVQIGIDVLYHMTVGDNPQRLKEMIQHAYKDCDMIIATGGLGPTQDDLTKETIADVFGERVVPFPEQLAILQAHFKKYNRVMSDNNLKQANFPEHAIILPNPNGTAPGFMLEKEEKLIISMPGPPNEMIPMFGQHVKPLLEQRSDGVLYYKTLRVMELGESMLETQVMDLIEAQTDPTLATYASNYESTLRIASKRKTRAEAEQAVEQMVELVRERIGPYIYSEEDESISSIVFRYLSEHRLTLSSAESCTGGSFAKAVTDRPGASAVFDRSIVTYSNRAKVEELGVSEETLSAHGAVSAEVAEEMARGIYEVSGSDIGISITGIAGPDGGSEEKPVGLVYIGLCIRGRVQSFRYQLRNSNRQSIRGNAVVHMFRVLYRELVIDK